MRKCFLHIAILLLILSAHSQPAEITIDPSKTERPKLIIGLVVDQMRWDYLYRYYDRYAENGGFKRLLNNGFSCENAFVNYLPSVTACGHAAIFTGSVPAVNGITGNDWWDYKLNDFLYCSADDSVNTVGSNTASGKMSPRNLLVTTIGDELKIATNSRSQVFGIALKDRGAILPAGHSADAAYWYDDKTGDWISSTYYMNVLPAWVTAINNRKVVDSCYRQGWKLLYPFETYTQSYTNKVSFGYDLTGNIGRNYGFLRVIPQGNSLTISMAESLIENEKLGLDDAADLLTISFSTPDYTAHTFGPNSIEAEDVFLRLDKELGEFFDYLDNRIGKNQYLLFLTADHGGAHVPSFLKMNHIPAGNVAVETIYNELNSLLGEKYKVQNLCMAVANYQVYLDRDSIAKHQLNLDLVGKFCIDYLLKQPGIENAFLQKDIDKITIPSKLKEMVRAGYYESRSGDIQLIFQPQWIEGWMGGGTTHGVFNPYDTHIPLLFYGWNIKPGKLYKEVNITDIAPTVSSLLNIQMPSGNTGKAISALWE